MRTTETNSAVVGARGDFAVALREEPAKVVGRGMIVCVCISFHFFESRRGLLFLIVLFILFNFCFCLKKKYISAGNGPGLSYFF